MSEAGSDLIRLQGIRKRFGFREVLGGVDFSLDAGECAALLGPNGAGKSTLVRIASTQWRPNEGNGKVLGLDLMRDAIRIRAQIGVVSHQSFLRDQFTLEENLRFYCDLHGRRFDDRCRELVVRLGLDHRIRDRVSTYSQGMRKRANIVRSLLHEPRLWFLDEPFAGLDAAGCDLLSSLIGDFQERGGAVVLVTHSAELATTLGTELYDLASGRLSRRGA